MILNVFLLVISIIIDGLIFYTNGLYQNIVWFWVPIILLPIIFFLLFGVELVILFIWTLFFDKKKEIKKPNKFYLWLVYQVNSQVVLFSNTKIITEGLEKIPNDSRYIILYNHLSNFDPMIIMHKLIKDDIVCVTKRGNESIPIAGPFIHQAGFIPIDRDNSVKSALSLVKAIRYLKNDYCSIAIAPEGTRNKEKKVTLLPFQEGVFVMAQKTKLPMVISIVINTDLIHKNFPFKRTKVNFKILEVLEYEDYKNKSISEINEYVYKIMKEALEV